jgi:hypothetical protein
VGEKEMLEMEIYMKLSWIMIEEGFAIRGIDRVASGQVLTKVWGRGAPRSTY